MQRGLAAGDLALARLLAWSVAVPVRAQGQVAESKPSARK